MRGAFCGLSEVSPFGWTTKFQDFRGVITRAGVFIHLARPVWCGCAWLLEFSP